MSASETINNTFAGDLGISAVVNAQIGGSTGHSISYSFSYSGSVSQTVTVPPHSWAYGQAGIAAYNSHGYVYDETVNCNTTDVYNVSSTSAPFAQGLRVW